MISPTPVIYSAKRQTDPLLRLLARAEAKWEAALAARAHRQAELDRWYGLHAEYLSEGNEAAADRLAINIGKAQVMMVRWHDAIVILAAELEALDLIVEAR